MTRFIARMALIINNVVFLIVLLLAFVMGAAAVHQAGLSGASLAEALLTGALLPLGIAISGVVICSMVALLGAIWLAVEEANKTAHQPVERVPPSLN